MKRTTRAKRAANVRAVAVLRARGPRWDLARAVQVHTLVFCPLVSRTSFSKGRPSLRRVPVEALPRLKQRP